jgi:hypothetical protein
MKRACGVLLGFLFASLPVALSLVGCGNKSTATSDGGTDALSGMTLTVTGAQTPLTPTFSPDITDYYVRCNAGTNDLTVNMTSASGTNQLLEPTPVSAAKSSQSLPVKVAEGAEIEVSFTPGKTTTQYFVRCLPHDFPAFTMTTNPDAGTPAPGYYLVGPSDDVLACAQDYAMAIDTHGVPIWYHPLGQTGVEDIESLEAGTISFDQTPGANEPFQILTLSTLTTTKVGPADMDQHELRIVNGHSYFFIYPVKTGFDLTGLKLPGNVDGGPNMTIQDCEIEELDESGNVVWNWFASDHFDPKEVSQTVLAGFYVPPSPPVYDVFHCNSIDVDPANGNLLVSAAGTNSIFYVEHSNPGPVLWKMGGAHSSKDAPTFISVGEGEEQFVFQHDARLLPGWSASTHGGTGQISLLDDQFGNDNGHPRAVVYDVVVGNSSSPGQAKEAWEFSGPGSTGIGGSFRITPENTRVIGWGVSTPTFSEVTEGKATLLYFEFPDDFSYRAVKIPASAFDIITLRNAAGK